MEIIQDIHDRLYELYKTYENVEYYVSKWIEVYDSFGNANFYIQYKDNERNKIDLNKTLHQIDGETLLKMAIDLGIETPDFIPSIPMFKNELKSSFETAAQTFEKAYNNVEKEPNLAAGLANSALESVIKAILKDERITIQCKKGDTLSKLIENICKAYHIYKDDSCPNEIKNIASSLIKCCKEIENMRSTKTEVHGKTSEDFIISDPLCTYFVVNAVATVGLFLLNYYKERFPQIQPTTQWLNENDLPF